MSETLANITTMVRALLRENTAGFFTDAQIAQWLNEAQRQFVQRTGCLRTIGTISTSDGIRDYALPTNLIDFNSIISLTWMHSPMLKLQRISSSEALEATTGAPYQESDPQFYWIEDGRIHVFPIPSDSSDAETTTVTATFVTAATSCTVADNSGFDWSTGRILVGSEVIEFRGKSSTTGLTSLRRGLEGTTAAQHIPADVVYERNLKLEYIKAPTTMDASNGSSIPDSYVHVLTYFAAGMGAGKRGDVKTSQHWLGMWESSVQQSIPRLAENSQFKDKYHQIRPGEDYGMTRFGRV